MKRLAVTPIALLFLSTAGSQEQGPRPTSTIAQIAKRVSPSVVVIQGETNSGRVLGSGFIVSKDGKIVTNLHVIRDLRSASVQLANGVVFDSVSILGTDELRDLAVVQIVGSNFVALDLGDSNALTVGEPVVVVGSPQGLEGTVTAGILSSVRDGGDGFNVLQTDAAVNSGNSGGPLVNSQGQAIGVISFKVRSAEGLNFAIPINYVRRLLENLHVPITLAQMRQILGASSTPKHQDRRPPLTTSANLPRCETKEVNGTMFHVCKRRDITCEEVTFEHFRKDPERWYNCTFLPFSEATITTGRLILPGTLLFMTSVLIFPTYRDSERVDFTITIEDSDHTFHEYVRRDIPIIIEQGLPTASVDLSGLYEPLGVPTVEAIEKGGKKGALHIYR